MPPIDRRYSPERRLGGRGERSSRGNTESSTEGLHGQEVMPSSWWATTNIDQAHQRHSSPRRGVPPTTYELNVRVRDEPAERGYRFDPLGSIDALIQDVVVLHMLAVVSLFSLQIHP